MRYLIKIDQIPIMRKWIRNEVYIGNVFQMVMRDYKDEYQNREIKANDSNRHQTRDYSTVRGNKKM